MEREGDRAKSFEETMMSRATVIVGIDEAGRGPLAGPVVAAACHIPLPVFKRKKSYGAWAPMEKIREDEFLIADSKALTPDQREKAFEWITQNCFFGIGIADNVSIDTKGILASTEVAMQTALQMLAEHITPTYVIIDGRDHFWFDYPHSSIIRGDDSEPTIAAASIIAKVTRDTMMIEAAKEFPVYGFDGHKGYGSSLHIEAIKKHGPCAIHRRTFLRNIMPTLSRDSAASPSMKTTIFRQ